VLEFCFAHITHTHFTINGSEEPLKREELLETGTKFINLFDKEHFFDYKTNME
jgi:hypothetical protein